MSTAPPTSPTSSSATPPPFLSRIWQTFIPLLAAIGLPTAAVAYYLTKYPLLALAIFLLYELGVIIIGFLGKVWGKLEDPLAEHVAAWLKQWTITFFSRYHRQYYAYIRYQHRDFDVRGLSTTGTFALELDRVFVELDIDPSTPQSAIVSPVQVPRELFERSHSIWDYLTSAPLRQQHLVVIGPPGSGKTTLLKHVVLSLVARQRLFHRHQRARVRGKLPILLFLRDHAQAIHDNEQYSLINAIRVHLSKWEQPLPPEGWFERHLRKGRCLVMLDGLDEVAESETRQQVVRWVERQMSRWHQNRFLVTSRPFGYRSNPLQNVTVLEVRAFTFEQVERFIHQWYLANEIMSKQKNDPGVRMKARSEARALLQRLSTTPALFDLTVNPLLLTMIATVHRYGGELPGKRVALYAEICEVFLGKRQMMRGQQMQFTPAQLQSVLEPLAYHMMSVNIRDIASDEAQQVIKEPLEWVSARIIPHEFLRLVENISGLLLERENGLYSFAHLTFQEFLAATHLKETQQGQLLASHVQDSWWRETIRLYCTMEDATPVLEACLQGERPQASAIELAIDCDNEALKVRPVVRARLETLLKKGVEDADPVRQHVIAKALLARRLRQMVHLKDAYVDTTLITCAEYQVFLDEQETKGRNLQPYHWTSTHFLPGDGNAPLLGLCASDALEFCAWLTERESNSWHYRLPEADELADTEILSQLPPGTGCWLEKGESFAWKDSPTSIPISQESVTDYCKSNQTSVYQLAIELDCTRGIVFTQSYSRTFKRLVSDQDLDRALELTLDRIDFLVRHRVRDIASPLSLDFDYTRVLNRARALVYSIQRPLGRAIDRVHGLARQHAHDIASRIDLILTIDRPLKCNLALIRTLALSLIFTCYREMSSDQIRPWQAFHTQIRQKEENELIDSLLNLFLDLVILERRIQGKLPACEGILIMKERK